MARREAALGMSPQYLIFIIVIVAMVLFFAGYVTLNKGGTSSGSIITISATGTVSATPTQGSIDLYLNATGNTSSSAVLNLSTITGRINSTLQPFLNGNANLIQTLSYNVYPTSNCTPIYYPITPSTTTICPSSHKFYEATEYLLITIPNVADTNAAIAGLSAIHGVSISNVASKLSAAQQANMSVQALSLALSNATSQASALASGKQVSVVNITVQNYFIAYPLAGVFSTSGNPVNQTFFAGTATVTKNIYVVFSMQR